MEAHRTIVLLGAALAGKSALVTRYGEDRFTDEYEPTLESNYAISTQQNGRPVSLRVRELGAGTFNPRITAGVDGYLLVFALNNRASFDTVVSLHNTLSSLVGDATCVPRVVVGTWSDVPASEREVPSTLAKSQAAAWKCPYIETSAKTGDNVSSVFETILDEIMAMESSGPKPVIRFGSDNPTVRPSTAANLCNWMLNILTCGYFGSSNNPRDDLRRELLRDADGPLGSSVASGNARYLALQSPDNMSPAFRKPFTDSPTPNRLMSPSLRSLHDAPSDFGYTPNLDVGSMRTGIQLAPHQAPIINIVPSYDYLDSSAPRSPARIPYVAVTGSDGATYLVSASGHAVGRDSARAFIVPARVAGVDSEEGSTGGTPHFETSVLYRGLGVAPAQVSSAGRAPSSSTPVAFGQAKRPA